MRLTTDSKCHRKRVIGMTLIIECLRDMNIQGSSTISTPHYLKDGFFNLTEKIFFFFLMNELKLYVRYVICLIVFKKGSELISQNKNSLEQSIN